MLRKKISNHLQELSDFLLSYILEPEVVEGESAICKAREISERPTIPTRSKSLKVGRFKGATNFRSVINNLQSF